MGQTDSN